MLASIIRPGRSFVLLFLFGLSLFGLGRLSKSNEFAITTHFLIDLGRNFYLRVDLVPLAVGANLVGHAFLCGQPQFRIECQLDIVQELPTCRGVCGWREIRIGAAEHLHGVAVLAGELLGRFWILCCELCRRLRRRIELRVDLLLFRFLLLCRLIDHAFGHQVNA